MKNGNGPILCDVLANKEPVAVTLPYGRGSVLRQAGCLAYVSSLIFAARTKSLSVRPLTLCVQISMRASPQVNEMLG